MPVTTWKPKKARLLWLGAIILTLVITAVLRLWGLPNPPSGPYYDEAANGILAANIANENYRPIFITSYTGKEVIFFYLAALVMKIAGSNLLALRLTSALSGIATVAAAYWCVAELYADRDRNLPYQKKPPSRVKPWSLWSSINTFDIKVNALSLLAATLLATSFWHLALSRIGLRAITQPLFQALTLAALWRGLRTGQQRTLIIAGVFCGLTGYTYLAARLFPFPLALSLLTLLLADRPNRRRRLNQIGAFAVAALVVIAPLVTFFFQNPERFTTRIEQVSAEGTTLTLAQALGKALGIFLVRGDPLARLNIPGMPIFSPWLAFFFLLGLLLIMVQLVTQRHPLDRARSVLLLGWIPLMILPTALTFTDVIPHNLRAAGLLPLVYLFPALGLIWLVDGFILFVMRQKRPIPQSIYWILWLVVLAACAPVVAHNYFERLAERSDHYEISDGDMADAAGWLNDADLTDSTVYIASVHYRHPTMAFMAEDYESFKWLTGGRTLVAPPEGTALVVAPRSVNVKWAQPYLASAESLPTIAGPDGKPAFQVFQLESDSLPDPGNITRTDFSHIIRLDGYDILDDSGGILDTALHWKVLNPPPRDDYQPFVHLLDSWGLTWSEIMPYQYTSAQWTPGERFIDRMRIPIPAGTPPGRYTLNVGWYSATAGANLNIVQGNGDFGGVVAQLPVEIPRSKPASAKPLTEFRQKIDRELLPGLRLLGANLDTTFAQTRQPIYLSLFWQAKSALEDIEVRLRLDGLTLYQGAPVHGSYSTTNWQPGESVVDRYAARVPLDTPDGEYTLVLQVSNGKNESETELGSIEISSPTRVFDQPSMQHAIDREFGNLVALLGYNLADEDRSAAALTLYWQALQEMETDYSVFVHLLDANGALVGQVDSQPQGGEYPTSLWASGEIVTDAYSIAIPTNADRPLSIMVGMYLPLTGDQLGEVPLN